MAYIYAIKWVYIHTHIYIYIYICVCMFVCFYMFMHMYIFLCVCGYTYTLVCVYPYTWVYKSAFPWVNGIKVIDFFSVWIWVYFAVLKQGFLYIKKKGSITTLKDILSETITHRTENVIWHSKKKKKKLIQLVQLKKDVFSKAVTNIKGNVSVIWHNRNHTSITTLKGCIHWGSHPRIMTYSQEQVDTFLWSVID